MRGVLLQLVVAAVAAECGCASAVALRISQGPEPAPVELAYIAPAVARSPLDASVLIRTDTSGTGRASEPTPAPPSAAPQPAWWPAAVPVAGPPSVAQRPPVAATRAIPASCSSGGAGQTIQLINGDRANAGLAPLALDAGLCQAAQWHAAQNAGWDRMTHDGVYQDVSDAGVHYTYLGEVLGTCRPYQDPGFINNLWMKSQEHHDIIDGTQYLRIGVGWAESSSGNWYVSAIVDS